MQRTDQRVGQGLRTGDEGGVEIYCSEKKRRIPWVSPRLMESICSDQTALMDGEEMAGSCHGVRQTSSGLLSCSLVLLLLSESSTDKQDTWAVWVADSTRDRQASLRNIKCLVCFL